MITDKKTGSPRHKCLAECLTGKGMSSTVPEKEEEPPCLPLPKKKKIVAVLKEKNKTDSSVHPRRMQVEPEQKLLSSVPAPSAYPNPVKKSVSISCVPTHPPAANQKHLCHSK